MPLMGLLGRGQPTSSPVGKQSFIDRPMLDRSIFDMCFDAVVGVGELCGRGFSKLTGMAGIGESNSLSDGNSWMSSVAGYLGLSGDAHSKQINLAQSPTLEVVTPAQSQDRFTVAMSDLGSFSPPNFDTSSRAAAGRVV